MVIDHIGAMLLPEFWILRLVGRLSFPIFAFGIARGVICTSNFKGYFCRILLAAFLSQPIYWFAFGGRNGNPLFTLAAGALVLWLWRKEGLWRAGGLFLLISAVWLDTSYGWYGVATIFFYGFYEERRSFCFYTQLLLQGVDSLMTGTWVQAFSLFAFPLMGRSWKRAVVLPKYFLYFFYPGHLLVLISVRYFIF